MNAEATKAVSFFGPDARFHHIGLVVQDIEAACPGLEGSFDPIQEVKVGFVDIHGAVVELIQPMTDSSPVKLSLAKGNKLLHLCFEVRDLESALAAAECHEVRQISEPAPAVAFQGRRIVWTFHPEYGLIELLERRN